VGSFEDLYRRHVRAVFRYARKTVRDVAVAEDLTADAFAQLMTQPAAIDDARVEGWLIRTVRNAAIDRFRRLAAEQRVLQHLASVPPPPAESRLGRWILESPELKPVHRTCVMLRYVYGMSRDEIAEETGLTEMQVKGHLQYALTLLRKGFSRRHHG
jgi:RNA polymerase sigma-70 factor, ECF subfamily